MASSQVTNLSVWRASLSLSLYTDLNVPYHVQLNRMLGHIK